MLLKQGTCLGWKFNTCLGAYSRISHFKNLNTSQSREYPGFSRLNQNGAKRFETLKGRELKVQTRLRFVVSPDI